MTESAEDKSKRKFIKHLNSTDWSKQFSIFYLDEQSSREHAIEDSRRLRKMLGKEYRQQPWLYRLCLLYRKFKVSDIEVFDLDTGEITTSREYIDIEDPQHIVFHTLFTTSDFTRRKYEEFQSLVKQCCNPLVNVRRQFRSADDLEIYQDSIKRQKPHNLKKYFGAGKKIHRFSLVNQAALKLIN
jgi:hypothetical protein